MFAKAREKHQCKDNEAAKLGVEDNKATADVSVGLSQASAISEDPLIAPSPTVIEPVKIWEPVPQDQQHELFKCILEEKRKVKPKDREEKKHIDEEKAILKQIIRAAESIQQL